MTEQLNEIISPTVAQEIAVHNSPNTMFKERIVRLNAIANIKFNNTTDNDLKKCEDECINDLKALGAEGGIQEMLAAQMLSTHQLQQLATTMGHKNAHTDAGRYFTNTAIKLANVFVQQAALFHKLKGGGDQRIVIERVNVEHGGQAIVGNVQGGQVKK